ncbi:MAG TPA: alanine racemase [Chiayiivirga sp.]|nr:alanine racemase [Chiayiivirga sp.]
MSREVVAHIDTSAVQANYALLQARAPGSRTLAVLKANAYGHDLEIAARALPQAEGFGVAAQREAERLRAIGVTQPILLFAGFDAAQDIAKLAQLQVRPALHHPSQLAMLEAQREQMQLPVALMLDSGMNRLGFEPTEFHQALARLRALPNVAPDILVMTHFAASDERDTTSMERQLAVFRTVTAGLDVEVSLANSAAVLDHPQTHGDWNRPGGALYGLSTKPGRTGAEEGLQPAMRLSTRLIAVRDKPAGTPIGYGGAYVCSETTRVGVAAIGYGDGYPRHAPTGTPVLVAGKRCRLIGRVSMDLITVDLAAAPHAQVGDEVVLWGDGLAIEEVAASAGTISYELSCRLTERVHYRAV